MCLVFFGVLDFFFAGSECLVLNEQCFCGLLVVVGIVVL